MVFAKDLGSVYRSIGCSLGRFPSRNKWEKSDVLKLALKGSDFDMIKKSFWCARFPRIPWGSPVHKHGTW